MKKIFIVTYVGLSADEADANGYCEAKAFAKYEDAKAYFEELISNEMECQKEFDPVIETHREREASLTWSGFGQGLKLKIHESNL